MLHILKHERDAALCDLIQETAASCDISILLIQNAVRIALSEFKTPVAVLADDLLPGEATPYRKIGYEEMLDMIFEHDAVVTW